jgi:hypothetical protein
LVLKGGGLAAARAIGEARRGRAAREPRGREDGGAAEEEEEEEEAHEEAGVTIARAGRASAAGAGARTGRQRGAAPARSPSAIGARAESIAFRWKRVARRTGLGEHGALKASARETTKTRGGGGGGGGGVAREQTRAWGALRGRS